MGIGYILGCCKCFTENDHVNIWRNSGKIKDNYYILKTGNAMLCFCKEQLEKIYGIKRIYNRDCCLLAAGDPPDEIYKIIGTTTNNKKIDEIIFDNIKKGFDFTENFGYYPYYCKLCRRLETHFYFEMVKNNEIYIPKYNCRICSNILGIGHLVIDNDIIIDNELIKLVESLTGKR